MTTNNRELSDSPLAQQSDIVMSIAGQHQLALKLRPSGTPSSLALAA